MTHLRFEVINLKCHQSASLWFSPALFTAKMQSEFCYESKIVGGWQRSLGCITEQLQYWITKSELEKEADRPHQ